MSSVPSRQAAGEARWPATAVLGIYTAAICLSAFLLFSVQPLFAKMLLPKLGGSPAVWSVATVVFQCLLLAGYAYAHALSGLSGRTAYLLHLLVLATAWLALPIALAPGWTQAPPGWEAPWLVVLMLASIGLPFFAVAANGPLLQSWFSRTEHRAAADPYFLYVASNVGSFAALAAYPLLLEPALRLRDQAAAWSAGFGALVLLIAIAGTMYRPRTRTVVARSEGARTLWSTRLVWVGLSAIPSGLLVAVTAHISTDVAPMPLLWIVPLSLYLLSFVVAFRPAGWLDDPRSGLLRVGLTGIALIGIGKSGDLAMTLAIHLSLFTLTALACHRMLFKLRPRASELTGFYLALSVGGAIGGLFCGLLAPLLFDTLAEYPIFLVAALACRPELAAQVSRLRLDALRTAAICAAIVATAVAAILAGAPAALLFQSLLVSLVVVGLIGWRSVATGLVAVASIVAVGLIGTSSFLSGTKTESIRSFFGIHRLLEVHEGRFRILAHGTTIHGAVRLREDDGTPVTGRPEPIAYYGYGQVIGAAIESVRAARGGRLERVAAVGLGAGSLACHRKPGEAWTFYEIDAVVVRIATERFPFLRECGQGLPVVLGDGRLTLKSASGPHDLIILDAFSSDAIPVHLLTSEAIGLYLSRLGPHGVLVMHISNQHLDLSRIVARAAAEHGLVAMDGIDRLDETQTKRMQAAARVIVLARGAADFGGIARDRRWTPLAAHMARRPWTDDYSNVLEALWDQRRPRPRPAD
jgi:hypothetical protein